MPKQFFSIPLGATPQLVEIQNLLRRKLPDGAVYNDPTTFHVTLVYVEDDKSKTIDVADVAATMPAFGIGASYLSTMDTPTGRAAIVRVQWNTALSYLQSAIYYRAVAAGMKISQFSYPGAWRPHITLATFPSKQDVDFTNDRDFDVFFDADFHVQVERFVMTLQGNSEPAEEWALQAEIPVQELLDRIKPNVEPVGEMTFNLHEQMSEPETDGRHQLTLMCVTEMKGGYPNIPVPKDILLEEIQSAGRKFVTLPIGQVDAVSRNGGRKYKRTAMEQLAEAINEFRLEGGWGHIKDEDIGTDYSPPALRWIAAIIDKQGILWGKALPLTSEAAQYYEDARLTNARVGTSLYGWATLSEQGDVVGLSPIKLDMADPARVGIPMTAAKPQLSSEMAADSNNSDEGQPGAEARSEQTDQSSTEEEVMSDAQDLVRISELEAERKTLREQVAALEKTVKELEGVKTDFNDVCEILGISGEQDRVRAARVLKEQHADMVAENGSLLEEAMKSMIEEQVKPEAVRPVVMEAVTALKPITKKQLTKAIGDVLARESIKGLLAAQVQEQMGPPQGQPVSEQGAGQGNQTAVAKHLDAKPEVSR